MPAGYGNSAPLPLTLPFAPGGGSYSQMRVLISTSDALEPVPVWTEYTHKMRDYSFSVGRSSERDAVDAGTATVTIDNNDRSLDPSIHAEVGPRNRLMLIEEFDGKSRVRFYGYVNGYRQQWPKGGIADATVEVRAMDGIGFLNASRMPVFDPPAAASYVDVIQADNPSAIFSWSQFTPMTTLTQTVRIPILTDLFTWYQYIDTEQTISVEMPGWAIPGSGGGYGVANDPAIVGDLAGSVEDGAGGSLSLQASGSGLYSTDRALGDMAGGSFSVELWFKRSAAPGANTMFWGGPQRLTGAPTGAREWQWRLLTTGAVDFTFVDQAGTARAVASGVLALDTWYHLVATYNGANFILYVNAANVAQTNVATSIASDVDEDHPMLIQSCGAQVYLDEMALYVGTALSAGRVSAHYQAGTARGFPAGQVGGTRIGAVLDSVRSQAPRSLRAGTRIVHPAFMAGRSPVDEAGRCELAEGPDGVFFCGLDGTLTFLDAGHRSVAPWNTSQMTFDDDGTDNAYTDIEGFDANDSFIVTTWNLIRIGAGSNGAVMQAATDAAAARRYGDNPQSMSDLPLTTNADVATIAAALLAKYKAPISRATALVPKTALPDVQSALMDLDLFEQVTVIRRPPGGGAPSTNAAWIQRWEQSGTPGLFPSVKLTVSSL